MGRVAGASWGGTAAGSEAQAMDSGTAAGLNRAVGEMQDRASRVSPVSMQHAACVDPQNPGLGWQNGPRHSTGH